MTTSPFTATASGTTDGPDMLMPWGKHRGKPLKDVPRSYLEWVSQNADAASDELKDAIKAVLNHQAPTLPFGDPPAVAPAKQADWPGNYDDEKRRILNDLFAARAEVDRLKNELANRREMEAGALRVLIRRWYGAMSRKHHPDAGGSAEKQAVVNVCHGELMNMLGGSDK